VTINPSSLSPLAGSFPLLTPNRLTQERAWQVAYLQLTAVLTKIKGVNLFLPRVGILKFKLDSERRNADINNL
jgi:hypothetical protein